MGVSPVTGLGFTIAGVALLVAGLVALFGAWALVACGFVLMIGGLLVDWERGSG